VTGPRVLLIGKRAAVLTKLAAALRERDIDADQVQDVSGDGVSAFDGYRAVAFGRAVREPDRARLRAAFTAADPDVVFVDGYAPIIPLLVAQFEQALDRRPADQRAVAAAVVNGPQVTVELRAACRLRVVSYRLDRIYRTHERVLCDAEVDAGTHTAALDARTARSREAFVVVRAGGETVALKVGAEQPR
jgi:hypothetical protein